MKNTVLFTSLMVVAIGISSTAMAQRKKKNVEVQPAPQPVVVVAPAPMFQNRMDTISYILGADIAKSFIKNEMKVNSEKMFAGFNDAMNKKDTIFSEKQVADIMKSFQEEMMKVFQAKKDAEAAKEKEMAEVAKAAGKTFLTANKAKEGVIELPSGLQYKILKEGTGAFPNATDSVTVHYKGTLMDGTVFDSSIERGTPITFPLDQVIKGWTEGLQKCKVGGKINLFIPSDLAYGDKATGPIPAGSLLIFEVELLKAVALPTTPEVKAPDAKAKVKAKPAVKTTAKTTKPAVKK
jgi:FKBP-type peptidyl-prolyl cis-trans isomerase